MSSTDTAFVILYYINLVVVAFVTISFIPQALFYLFFFLPRKHWKETKNIHPIAVVIPAHNEEAVIGRTVKHLRFEMNYPKEKYKVYVVCHNCSDHTKEEALKAGADGVYVLNDPDKSHACEAYPLRYGTRRILAENPEAELFIRFDADNYPHPNYLKEMNKSFDGGAKIIRGYEAAYNLKQNLWTEECAIFYFKDSRVQNTFRQFFHSTAMTTGPGLSFSRDIAERMNGWDCMTKCEDAEFDWKRLFDGYKAYFNTDAIVYEDQPSTLPDTYNRLVRLGHSLNKLFFTDGWKMLVAFLRTGKPMYLDMLIQISFNPVSFLCFTWFPLYYIAYAICMLMQLSGVPIFTLGYFQAVAPDYLNAYQGLALADQLRGAGYTAMMELLKMAVQVILSMSLFCIFQSWIALFLDRRKLGMDYRLKGMWKGILLSPIFSLIYGICNFVGVVSAPSWKIAKRNPSNFHIDYPLPEQHRTTHYFTISEREKKRYDGHWWKKSAKPVLEAD